MARRLVPTATTLEPWAGRVWFEGGAEGGKERVEGPCLHSAATRSPRTTLWRSDFGTDETRKSPRRSDPRGVPDPGLPGYRSTKAALGGPSAMHHTIAYVPALLHDHAETRRQLGFAVTGRRLCEGRSRAWWKLACSACPFSH